MLQFLMRVGLQIEQLQAQVRVEDGLVKEHAVPPCLVLVIDDNLYGLMVALSYI